ncbi:MAG: TorF family putative porin [Gammaproteobacteria bacterium]|nr:TorF family putative porin [Gammaproteobacteria bacterium]MDD9894884.1 TorF family putative porin [Gammaproteobacteria bacterium]MDD9958861.1 TorF family putative porin [Gammaproteobacteria bacterium]
MKKLTHLFAGLILASSGLLANSAYAELSYNIGWASEYYFRGILQKESSGSVGVDWEDESGFYIGSWAADVGDGLEVDGYFGYNYEFDGGFTVGVGFTGYYYTGEFDDTYEEVNFSLGYGPLSLGYSVGEWGGFGAEQDYDFLELTYTAENGIYGTFGTFGDEFDGDYIEIGWGTTISEIDIGVAAIFSSDELSDQLDSAGRPDESEAVIFTIGKSF